MYPFANPNPYPFTPGPGTVKYGLYYVYRPVAPEPPSTRRLPRKPSMLPPSSPKSIKIESTPHHPVDLILKVISVHLYGYFYVYCYTIVHEQLHRPNLTYWDFLSSIKPRVLLASLGHVLITAVKILLGLCFWATKKLVQATVAVLLLIGRNLICVIEHASQLTFIELSEVRQLLWEGFEESKGCMVFVLNLVVLCAYLLGDSSLAAARQLRWEGSQNLQVLVVYSITVLLMIIIAYGFIQGLPCGTRTLQVEILVLAGLVCLTKRTSGRLGEAFGALWAGVLNCFKILSSERGSATQREATIVPRSSPPAPVFTPESSPIKTYPPSPLSLRRNRQIKVSPSPQSPVSPLRPKSTQSPKALTAQGLGRRAKEFRRLPADCNGMELQPVNRIIVGVQDCARPKADTRKWRI